jgi:hypothetical protein
MASMKDCCCGVDVHKSFIVAVIAKLKGKDVTFTGYKRFSTFKKGLLEFKAWLGENDCYEICMESTGKYYIPVYRTVADETFHVLCEYSHKTCYPKLLLIRSILL